MKKVLSSRGLRSALITGVAAVAISGVLLQASGVNALTVYRVAANVLFSRSGFSETLLRAIPLVLIGLGISVAVRAGIWNIGAEGQFFVGAASASFIALRLEGLEGPVGLTLALLAGFAAGAAWATLASLLKVAFGANEIVATLMLNFVAIQFVSFLVSGPWRDPRGTEPLTARFPGGFDLPIAVGGTRLHVGVFLIPLAVAILLLLLRHTVFGYQLKVVGMNESAARYAAMSPAKVIVLSMVASGGLAGLAGANEILGTHHRLFENISPGYGFTGIAVALLGRGEPLGIAVAGVFFAALMVVGSSLQGVAGVSVGVVFLVQGLLILIVLVWENSSRIRWRAMLPSRRIPREGTGDG